MISTDRRYMECALRMGARGLGMTWPNPSVGCVLVKNERIIGAAHSAPAGGPHAETRAMEQAGPAACQGATAYVTLEPCSHHGKTPPCAEALIKAGITRVVIAATDPDARVNGRGVAMLREAGIEVVTGVLEDKANAQHAGFFSRITRNRPYISLKIATSADGMIATESGESQWITGDAARNHGHSLRANHDAILTGIGTVLADDPQLTCRLPGLQHRSPVRIVLDSHLQTPANCRVLADASTRPAWIITTDQAAEDKRHLLEQAGAQLIVAPTDEHSHVDVKACLHLLAEQGITRLLVEAGPAINSTFVHGGWVDALYWYRAPFVIGGSGKSAFSSHTDSLAALPRWQCVHRQSLGADSLSVYHPPQTKEA